jgi:hypothetical protein
MKTSMITLLLVALAVVSKAQVYTIPWAQVQPEWVFPLWFEDATGAKDTLYLAYDYNCGSFTNPDIDTLYGDNLVLLDTSKFQVLGCNGLPSNLLVRKSDCVNPDFFYIEFCFWKCQLPLIVRWDVNLFRSDVLPFADQSPAPRAQGLLWYDLPLQTASPCHYSVPVLLSDSSIFSGACSRVDSISFYNNPPIFGLSQITLYIVPWTGKNFTSVEIAKEKSFNIYPNPVDDLLHIQCNGNGLYNISITNMQGQTLLATQSNADMTLEVDNIPAGIYILKISNSNTIKSIKLLKQ